MFRTQPSTRVDFLPMRIQRLASSLLLGASLVACTDLDLTNPNQPSAAEFWRTSADARAAVSATYDFEVNREIWQHHYQAIFRANQVIANVPNIEMDATERERYVAEAKFIR